jgi:hypothetical protein
MGHFYLDDPPRPFYEVEYSDKKGVLDKPGLMYWRLQQMAEATRHTVISLGGDWDEYGWSEAYNLYKKNTEEAAKRGTEIHDVIENSLLGKTQDLTNYMTFILDSIYDWLSKESIVLSGIEEVFVSNKYGIGGKIDLVMDKPFTIVDWKTIDTKNKEFRPYTTDKTPLLAAYSMGRFNTLDANLWNVFISRDEPGLIIPKLYTREEVEYGWKKFQLCYNLWVHDKQYDPRKV